VISGPGDDAGNFSADQATQVVLETSSCIVDWFGQELAVDVVENDGQFPLLGVGLLLHRRLEVDYPLNPWQIAARYQKPAASRNASPRCMAGRAPRSWNRQIERVSNAEGVQPPPTALCRCPLPTSHTLPRSRYQANPGHSRIDA
jgi:hypothetical protein